MHFKEDVDIDGTIHTSGDNISAIKLTDMRLNAPIPKVPQFTHYTDSEL